MKDLHIKVKAYAGHKAGEKPFGFTLQDKEYRIEEIIETAVEERAGRRLVTFRVRTEDGIFKIYCSQKDGEWYLEK